MPCIECNALGAIKAVSAASLALRGTGEHFMPLDNCIRVMRDTGRDMNVKYRLGVASHADAATVEVMNCGQYHAPATTGNYVARGGRLALTDTASVGIEASGQAEVILGPDCTIPAGKKLRIVGSMGKVGWDMPDGAARLLVEGVLEFHVTPVLEIGSGTLTGWSFQLSDMRGATSGATGKWDSWRQIDRARVRVRVRDISGAPMAGEATVSAIRNHAGEEPPVGTGVVTNILPGEIGQLRLFRSGRWGLVASGVTTSMILAAGAEVAITALAWLAPGTYDLTGPGITVTDQGATLPEGVTVAGGRLRLRVG